MKFNIGDYVIAHSVDNSGANSDMTRARKQGAIMLVVGRSSEDAVYCHHDSFRRSAFYVVPEEYQTSFWTFAEEDLTLVSADAITEARQKGKLSDQQYLDVLLATKGGA